MDAALGRKLHPLLLLTLVAKPNLHTVDSLRKISKDNPFNIFWSLSNINNRYIIVLLKCSP